MVSGGSPFSKSDFQNAKGPAFRRDLCLALLALLYCDCHRVSDDGFTSELRPGRRGSFHLTEL